MDWFKTCTDWYISGHYDNISLKTFVIKGKITNDQYLAITGVTYTDTLKEMQDTKLAQIQDAYDKKLSSGFPSSASGTLLTFRYSMADQLAFIRLKEGLNDCYIPIPFNLSAVEGIATFTDATQFTQLFKDLATFDMATQTQYHTLNGQVRACTTVDQVNALVISF
jgi:uncharacterized XkdX family phage protein